MMFYYHPPIEKPIPAISIAAPAIPDWKSAVLPQTHTTYQHSTYSAVQVYTPGTGVSVDPCYLPNNANMQFAQSIASNELSEAEQIARRRVKLIALRQEGDASDEVLTRLEMLNVKLLKIAPRVTAEQVDKLHEISNMVDAVEARRAARAKARNERMTLQQPSLSV